MKYVLLSQEAELASLNEGLGANALKLYDAAVMYVAFIIYPSCPAP